MSLILATGKRSPCVIVNIPIGCFLNNSWAMYMRTSYQLWCFCATLFHCRHLLFTWKTHQGLKFHLGQFDWSEIRTEVSFALPEVLWTLIMKLAYTEVKFYPEVKSQTGFSSLWVSCKNAIGKNYFLRYLLIKSGH